ncbi:MAG: MFS transporter [Beijerinckiaceae bacterium]|nr:MFS transporter [Beijerinckiaceae bacterium]
MTQQKSALANISLAAALTLAAGFLVLFVGNGARMAIGLTLRPMVADLNWGRGEIGAAVGVFQFASALCMFAAGRMADRMSLRLVLCAGLAICAVGIGAMMWITEPWQAIALYGIVFGIGSGMASTIPVGVMVTRAFPGRTGLANSVALSGMCVGQLIIIAILAAILAQAGWRSIFFWVGVAHLAVLPLILATAPGRPVSGSSVSQPADGKTIRQAARTKPFWLLMGIYGVCGFNDFFVAAHVVAFAQDSGVDALFAGNLLALMGLTGFAGVLWAGMAADRFGPVWPTLVAFFIRIAAFGLVLIDASTVSIAVFALSFGLTFFMTAPPTVLFVRESFGMRHLGALTGIITMVHHAFGGLGAWMGALVFDAAGSYTSAFAAMLAATLVAVGLTFMYARDRAKGVA